MSTYQFNLKGAYTIQPLLGGDTSFAPSVETPICETAQVVARHVDDFDLTSDSPFALSFGGVTNAHIVILKTSGHVKVTVTSADGTSQVIPCDGFLQLQSKTVPITAISLTRDAATETTGNYVLCQTS